MMANPGDSGAVGVGEEAEEEGRKPGRWPGSDYLLDEMKQRLSRYRVHDSSQACHDESRSKQTPNTDTNGPQVPVIARQLRRYTLSGAVDAMKVPLCPKHHRNLELFCLSDLECICIECGQTEHQSHDVACAEKEWHGYKVGCNEE